LHDATAAGVIGGTAVLVDAIAAVPLLIWIYLLAGRGAFWRVSKGLAREIPQITPLKHVVAVIPARNEAGYIGETIASLLQQDFPAPLHIVVVDDGSSDGTAELACAAAQRAGKCGQLTVIKGEPLPAGWTGKLWAVAQGVTYVETLEPDYLLLTDADIRHGRYSVAGLVGTAESGRYDLASYMVKLTCSTTAEKALIPAFVFFFLKLYPPVWIRSEKSKTAGAAGGCILIRVTALRRIGGIAAIRHEMIDDCALARAVKHSGGRIWMGLTDETDSTRSYGDFAEIGRMISRTAFNQLRHSRLLLATAVIGLFFTYLLPPLLLFTHRGIPSMLGATAWLLMSFSYLPIVRFYRRSSGWAFALPLIAAFYLGATIHSAVQYWRGQGGQWKGRFQDARLPR
jgi:hopene-associated glycosyltransferase HpnB